VKPFIVNRHGSLVLPSNFFPEIDFSRLNTLEQFAAVVKRDFELKAPAGPDLMQRVESRTYQSRYDLLRDLGLHLFWMNRYAITMYEKRPVAWRHVRRSATTCSFPSSSLARRRAQGGRGAGGVQPLAGQVECRSEYRIFARLFDVYSNRRHHAAELPAIKPTVAEIMQDPSNLTFHIGLYDPDFSTFSFEEIVDCHEEVPELEALMRWAMVLYNQYPWHRQHTRLIEVGKICDDDVIAVFYPRNREVLQFIRRVKSGHRGGSHAPSPAPQAKPRRAPLRRCTSAGNAACNRDSKRSPP